ncbi:MAG TPA: hypothetical protein VGN07_06465 [Steroidobacteraceae bacterium]|jgi:hypothetical protein
MKTRIAVGAGLLLTIGSAVAGTMMYGQGRVEAAHSSQRATVARQEVTAQTIEMWKETASSSGYIAPRVPI